MSSPRHPIALLSLSFALCAPLAVQAQAIPPAPTVFTCDVVPFPLTASATPLSKLVDDMADNSKWWARVVDNAKGTAAVGATPAQMPAASATYIDSLGNTRTVWGHYFNTIGYAMGPTYWWYGAVGFHERQISDLASPAPSFVSFQYRFALAPEVVIGQVVVGALGMEASDPVVRVYANGQPVTADQVLVAPNAPSAPSAKDAIPTGAATASVSLDNPAWQTGLNTIEVVSLYQDRVEQPNTAAPQAPHYQTGFFVRQASAQANCDPVVTLAPPQPVAVGNTLTLNGQAPVPRMATGTPVTLDVLDSGGAVLFTLSATLAADGSYTASAPIPLPAGSYRVRPTFGLTAPDLFVGDAVVVNLQVLPSTPVNPPVNPPAGTVAPVPGLQAGALTGLGLLLAGLAGWSRRRR